MIKINMKIILLLLQDHMNQRVVRYMKGNGKEDKNMVEENKFGKMVPYMKDTGKIIKLMDMED